MRSIAPDSRPANHQERHVNPSSSLWTGESPPRLRASRHVRSGTLRFPPFRPESPLAAEHEPVNLAATGRLYSLTTIHPNPKSGQAAFVLGYVDLPGPVRIFGRVRGEGIRVGSPCQVVPDPQFGYVFQVLPS
jgi:uncharacterized OB-fold protein